MTKHKGLLMFSLFFVLMLHLVKAQELKIATYNIRNANKSDSINGNGWGQRLPIITKLIEYNQFDIIGMQEVLHSQKEDLENCLTQYKHIGVGRDDAKTKGEYASIFFKINRFDLIESGTFWLSQITDKPNKGWDAALPRICTWVQLKDKKHNKKIWFFNLHMDHIGVLARHESSKLVIDKIRQMCQADAAILVGDFNVDQRSESYKILANAFQDAYEASSFRYAFTGTFNGFNPNNNSDDRIDHVFINSSLIAERYAILTDSYRSKRTKADNNVNDEFILRLPSDHFPISVELKYKQ